MTEEHKRLMLMLLGWVLVGVGIYFLLSGRVDHQVTLAHGVAQTSSERVKPAPGWGLLLCTLGGATLVSVARRH